MERYIHTDRQTDRQSDMAFFFLRMRLLASPFGLAMRGPGLRAARDYTPRVPVICALLLKSRKRRGIEAFLWERLSLL
jgi:hypothetical protein